MHTGGTGSIRWAAVLVVLAMFVAACGDSTDTEQTEATADLVTTSTTTSGGMETTTTAQQTTTTADEIEASVSGSEFCRLISQDQESSEELDYSDPEQLEAGFTESIERLEEAARLSPDDLQDDMELILERFQDFSAALEDADWDLFAVSDADARVTAMEQPEVIEALNRVSDECLLAGTAGGDTDDTPDGDAIVSGTIPDVLLPPQAGEVLAESPLFTIGTSATYDELVAYYTDVFGSMSSESDEQATFLGQIEGEQTAVWVIKDPDRGVIVTISRP